MAAKLHRHARHAVGAEPHQMLSNIGRAGEADLANDAAGDERLADEVRVAVNELGDALGNAGISERAEKLGRDARSFVRRPRDDGATGRERSADLFGQQVKREVPRGEGRDWANRLSDHAAELTGGADERPAIVALHVFGVPVEQLGGGERFELRLIERLTLLLGHRRGDEVDALADQRRGIVQDRSAFLDVHCAPFRPGAVRRFQRLVEVRLRGVGDGGDRLGVDWIDDVVAVSALAGLPGTVDEELEVGFVSHGAPDRHRLKALQRQGRPY